MPSAELLIPFLLASVVFACVPGPGMLYAAAQTIASSRRTGWWSALGFHLAGLLHVAAAAFGASALLTLVPAMFTVMKFVGAGYLVWLGIRYLRAPQATLRARRRQSAPSPLRALRDGVIVEALNPKTALFHLAFLPQFTDAAASLPVWAQVLVLGAIVNAMFSATDAVLIETAHAVAHRLRSSEHFMSTLRRVGGAALVALGVNLALARSQ
jgi:threonine/homoserine/homoserine lactone efflux protein